MKLLRAFFLVAVPCLLLLCSLAVYRFASAKGLYDPSSPPNITYERYSLTKTQAWKERFDFQHSEDYNSERREIAGTRENFLEVRRGPEEFLIEYDAEIDLELIGEVREVREQGEEDSGARYFLVQYERFVEIVLFETAQQSSPFEAEICLELPIPSADNARYHADPRGNIWIVTASMNKVVFVQVYSCRQRKLLAEFRHVLSDGQNVLEVARILRRGECMTVEVVTYGLHVVELEVCPYSPAKSVTEREGRRSHRIAYEQVAVPAQEFGVLQGDSESVWREEVERIGKYIFSFLTLSPAGPLLLDRPASSNEHLKERFDAIAIDEQNHYLVEFSGGSASSGAKALDRFMINAKNPLFHGNALYDRLDLLGVLDRQYRKEPLPDVRHRWIIAGLNTTRRATYKAAFRAFPEQKVEHLGVTSKVIVFHPQEGLDEKDYSFVRTREGGLVSEGSRFKGSFDKVPRQFEEVFQRVDAKAIEVVPGVFEAHVGYVNLMTYPVQGREGRGLARVELLNMLGGRPVLTHYISGKEGFAYVSTMLLNSEWWVLEYSQQLRRGMATKYELYANASAPSQVLSLKRVYGVVGSEEHANGEDDLAQLMSAFETAHGNGYMLLSVYRCIDEYYYVEYSDAAGKVFGVARLHFKSLSNRRLKKSKKYAGSFERALLLDESDMIPERYSRKPYSVYLKNTSIFSHLPALLDRNDPKETWHSYCERAEGGRSFRKLQKLGGFHYFPITHYAIGSYGCDYGSDSAHPESFHVFNLRSMIIDGKIQAEGRGDVRRRIVEVILAASGAYIAIAAICLLMSKKQKKEQVKQNEKDKDKYDKKKTEGNKKLKKN